MILIYKYWDWIFWHADIEVLIYKFNITEEGEGGGGGGRGGEGWEG